MQEWFEKFDKETIVNFFKQLLTPEVILQIGLVVLILLIAGFIKKFLRKWMVFSETTLMEFPWLKSTQNCS